MKRHGQPQWFLTVYGDWQTVIGVRNYRDALLDQSPSDDEEAEYHAYRIPCENTGQLFAAYRDFSAARLRCAVTVNFRSEDKAMDVWATTDHGFGKPEPSCSVMAKLDDMAVVRAANAACEILKEAIK